ncbi:MAG: hypothetical protein ABEI75_01330 [Halobaculum sp.]
MVSPRPGRPRESDSGSYLPAAGRPSGMEGSDLFFAVVVGFIFLLILIGLVVSLV